MPPELENNVTPPTEETRTPLEIIRDLREHTVSRQQYDDLDRQYNELLEAYANGERSDGSEEPTPEQRSLADIRRALNDPELSNLDYCRTALELRDRLISEGRPDPFLPVGARIAATPEDELQAQRVADALAYCIEEADGEDKVFTAKLQTIMIDTSPFKGVNKTRR